MKEIELCLEVSTIPIKLRDTAVQVVEISKTQAAVALSPFKARLFVTVKLTPPTSSSSNYTAKKIKVDIKFGSLINNQVKEAARSVASKMTEILTIQQSDAVTVLENKVRRHARSVSMDAPVDSNNSNSPQDRGRSVSTASAGPVDIGVGDAITIPATLVPVLSEKSESKHGVTIISGLRPVRLFQVCDCWTSVLSTDMLLLGFPYKTISGRYICRRNRNWWGVRTNGPIPIGLLYFGRWWRLVVHLDRVGVHVPRHGPRHQSCALFEIGHDSSNQPTADI